MRDGYEVLRDAIVDGRLQPRQRLIESRLVAEFDLAPSAVRLALVRLEQDGLVARERFRGAHVRYVDEAEAIELIEAIGALKTFAVVYAARRAGEEDVAQLRALLARLRELLDEGDLLRATAVNSRLHHRILQAARHETIARMVATASPQISRFGYQLILVPGGPADTIEEHERIVEAIAAHDEDAAVTAMREHMARVTDGMRSRYRGESVMALAG